MQFLQISQIKPGDIVSIKYTTYNSCEPKVRSLNNLEVVEILPESIKFIQKTKTLKKYWINNSDIVRIYK